MNKAIAMLCVVLLLLSGVFGIPGQINAKDQALRVAENETSIGAVVAHSRLVAEPSLKDLIREDDLKFDGEYRVYRVFGLSAQKLKQLFGGNVVFFPADKVILVLMDQEA